MITKRELLVDFSKTASCGNLGCDNCPYQLKCLHNEGIHNKLTRIGAMAVLRMFKKKPVLEVGTRIKFSDGSIATIISTRRNLPILTFTDDESRENVTLDYLVGRVWEIIDK